MKIVTAVFEIVLCIALVSGQQCPTWFVHEANKCVCGKQIDTELQCSNVTNKTRIIENHCLTYNNGTEHFGACPYNTKSHHLSLIDVPSDVSKLDEEMCGPLNRTGLLCSHCQPGLGPAVFSYYRECKKCLPHPYGWLLYFVRLIVPLTLLCVLVIVFRINIAHPVLNIIVIISQIATNVFSLGAPFSIYRYHHSYSTIKFLADTLSIFNLDFFLLLIPSFCISENMSTLTIIAMEYLTAFYPILFTLAAYMLVTLHDRGCKIVVNCWRPFYKCLARCRRSWEVKGSVVNAFVTFLILSYSKFCSISLSLLKPTRLYNKFGNVTYTLFFAADFNINAYIPLAILASIITVVMIFLPAMFLLFYQNRFFQQCLTTCKIKCVLIHELANITQAYFKNGTSGTPDYRWIACLYLFSRIIFIGMSAQRYHYLVDQMVYIIFPVFMVGLRPYKKNFYNYFDAIVLQAFAIGSTLFIYQTASKSIKNSLIDILALGIPMLYFLLVLLWMLCTIFIKQYGHRYCCRRLLLQQTRLATDSLPHRIDYPKEYEPLIQHN